MSNLGEKNDQGKPPMELLDWEALKETALVMSHGEKKYGAYNWRKGLSQRRALGAALRHIYQHLDGANMDEESRLLHLAHAMCEVMFAIRMLKERPDLDDRYKDPGTKGCPTMSGTIQDRKSSTLMTQDELPYREE